MRRVAHAARIFRLSLKRKPAKKLSLFIVADFCVVAKKNLCRRLHVRLFFCSERRCRRSMPATLSRLNICFDSALGRSSVRAAALSSCPACRHVLPCPCRQSPALFQPTRCPSSAECANARPNACGGCESRLPIRSAAAAPARSLSSHCGARLPLSLSPGFVRPAVALAPPRNPRTRAEWPIMWLSRAIGWGGHKKNRLSLKRPAGKKLSLFVEIGLIWLLGARCAFFWGMYLRCFLCVFRYDLACDAPLTCNILRVVVNIDAQTCIS